jgi:hypothetical protein
MQAASIPQTLPDVLDRMNEIQSTGRLALDEAFFDWVDRFVGSIAAVTQR